VARLVFLENPLRNGALPGCRNFGWLGGRIHFFERLDGVGGQLAGLRGRGENDRLGRVGAVAPEPVLEGITDVRSRARVVVADVLEVVAVGEAILRDDVKVAPVKGRVALEPRRLPALAEDHVRRHESPRIGAAKDDAAPRQILQNVVAEFPAEPPVALRSGSGIERERPRGQREQEPGRRSQARDAVKNRAEDDDGPDAAEDGKHQVRVGVVGHLRPPTDAVRVRAIEQRLEEGGEQESAIEQVNPDARGERAAHHSGHGREEKHEAQRRETPGELEPEKLRPLLESLHQPGVRGIGGRLLIVERRGIIARRRADGFLGNAHGLAQHAQALVGEAAVILAAIERVEKSIRRARVAPVHRGIRRCGKRHVRVGEQPEDDRERQKCDEPPVEPSALDPEEHHESRPDQPGQPDRRFDDDGIVGDQREAQVRDEDAERGGGHEVPEKIAPHQQHDQERERRERERELVI